MFRTPTVVVVAVVGAVVAIFGVAAAPSHATYRGKNGLIAFRRYFNNDHNKSAILSLIHI